MQRILLLLGMVVGAWAQSAPPAVVVSKNVCPFEGCTYRDWTASRDVPLYDKPQGKVIGNVQKNAHVEGISGDIYAHPVAYRLSKADTYNKLPKGTLVYALHPVGEGVWQVWWKGRFLSVDLSSMGFNGKGIDYQWWAKVRTRNGDIRWVLINVRDMPFQNTDRHGSSRQREYPLPA